VVKASHTAVVWRLPRPSTHTHLTDSRHARGRVRGVGRAVGRGSRSRVTRHGSSPRAAARVESVRREIEARDAGSLGYFYIRTQSVLRRTSRSSQGDFSVFLSKPYLRSNLRSAFTTGLYSPLGCAVSHRRVCRVPPGRAGHVSVFRHHVRHMSCSGLDSGRDPGCGSALDPPVLRPCPSRVSFAPHLTLT
jgi:hypothetical protein